MVSALKSLQGSQASQVRKERNKEYQDLTQHSLKKIQRSPSTGRQNSTDKKGINLFKKRRIIRQIIS